MSATALGRAQSWAAGSVVALVVALTVVPAAILFATSVAAAGGEAGILAVAQAPATLSSIDQSLVQGSVSALLAVALGYPAGVFLGRYRWWGRSAVRSFLLVPFLLPSLVVVFGLRELFGPSGYLSSGVPALGVFGSGLPAIVATNLVFNVPLVILFTSAGCENADRAVEETVASLGGGPMRAYRESWLGPSWTGASVGGLLTFVFSALSFAPPLLLCRRGCATVEVEVWQLWAGTQPDPAAAGVLALLLVALFAVPMVAYLGLARRLSPRRERGEGAPRTVPWRAPFAWALAALTALVVGAELALLAVVVAGSVLPPGGGGFGRGWSQLFSASVATRLDSSVGALVARSLLFAGVAAGIAVVVALVLAFVGRRHRPVTSALGVVTFLPVLLSPVVLAFALERTWGGLVGGPANVWVLICVSQALLGLPFALQSLELPLASLPAGVRESTEALGATPWGAFVDAELPRIAPGIERAALFALALGLGEFTATFFLVTPAFTTLPVAVYALETRGLLPASEAAAALLLLLSLAVYALTVYGGRRGAR
jgi:thiamine transport system permease protein